MDTEDVQMNEDGQSAAIVEEKPKTVPVRFRLASDHEHHLTANVSEFKSFCDLGSGDEVTIQINDPQLPAPCQMSGKVRRSGQSIYFNGPGGAEVCKRHNPGFDLVARKSGQICLEVYTEVSVVRASQAEPPAPAAPTPSDPPVGT
jgi:hypothetical protein